MSQNEEPKGSEPTPKAHPETSSSPQSGSNGSGLKLPEPSPHLQRMVLPEGVGLTKGARKEVMKQHREWQQMLIGMIKQGSQVVVSANGALQHVLPSKLVSLVWRTTIQQRIEIEKAAQEEAGTDVDIRAARQAALKKISDEQDDQIALEEAYAIVKAARIQARAKQAQLKAESNAEEQPNAGEKGDGIREQDRADQPNERSSGQA